MGWFLLTALVLGLGVALGAALLRREELRRMASRVAERERAVRLGGAEARLQHPVVDLTLCVGCGACVRACPEEGVLDLVHGQAVVVNGARCTGVSACEPACPTGAITVALTGAQTRRDIPAVDESLEASGVPGLFLAGEVTARALIQNALVQGAAVAAEVARRAGPGPREGLDLVIVGAGPAGIACSLEARRLGLSFATLDQEPAIGGTVARYPRRKLVLTNPVRLPNGAGLARRTYEKEELVALWASLAASNELPIHAGERVLAVERGPGGGFVVRTATRAFQARHVCLALGRRGSPTKLGVPGEDLAKVAYALTDANAYQGRRVLVVGGGESAAEAALALSEQPGNDVTIAYRQEAFFRLRQRTQERLAERAAQGRIRVLFRCRVLAIREGAVDLALAEAGAESAWSLPNDEVFVMAGGTPPFELLEAAGVSFDPAARAQPQAVVEQGSGLVPALAVGLALTGATLGFALWHGDYYGLTPERRAVHELHADLRPGMGTGLALGITSAVLVAVNLLYLARRSQRARWLSFGSLKAWMTSHVATGILALLLALLHAGMTSGDSIGGNALTALIVLFASGALGRYLYAYVPRAANGRELELEEVRVRLARLAEGWTGAQRAFGERARATVAQLVESRQWRSTFAGRALALVTGRAELTRALAALRAEGRAAGVPPAELESALALAREAHRTATAAAHFEDLRALVAGWRWVHRWVALALVLLLVIHVVVALLYGAARSLPGGLT
ncbi:MAG: NAD(P)-binding domain-containing protein [Planctomycetes bacterium]|nr:NAD(P)-binding domain-containing protein [Planctomycetota bacterium]